jgi:hypothetical protein
MYRLAWWLVLLLPLGVCAQEAEEIVRQADLVRAPSAGFIWDVTVTASEPGKSPTVNGFEVYVKGGAGSKVFVKFVSPARNVGRSLLALGRDLWIYLPDAGKPVRIPLAQRLVGQVANGDIARTNYAGDYTPTSLGSEQVDRTPRMDHACFGKFWWRVRLVLIAMATLLLLASLADARAFDAFPDWLKALRVRGRLKEELAYRLHDPGAVSKLRTLGWLEAKYTSSEAVHLRLEGRGWWDGVFDATGRYPRAVERDQETELSLRQALLAVSAGPFDVRLGRQQIVWGEAIGTFITDVVNPKDFREFVLPEYTELRIPLWAVNGTYHLAEGLNLEGVWTPDIRFNKVGKPGSEFQFQPPRFRFQQPVVRLPDAREEFSVPRSEGGFRLSWLVKGWDLSLLYYDAADKTPVLRQRRVPQATGSPTVFLQPRHPRLHIVGVTLSQSLEPVVIRSEAAFTIGKRYETTDTLDTDGVVRRDTLDYLVGIDYTFLEQFEVALQFSQKLIAGSATNLTRGAVEARVTSSVSVRLTTEFFDSTLHPTLLWAINVNRGDYRLSARIEYLLRGSVTVTLGVDLFAGPLDTLYGQFDASDRVYLEVGWRF